jgi:hypothetical protein
MPTRTDTNREEEFVGTLEELEQRVRVLEQQVQLRAGFARSDRHPGVTEEAPSTGAAEPESSTVYAVQSRVDVGPGLGLTKWRSTQYHGCEYLEVARTVAEHLAAAEEAVGTARFEARVVRVVSTVML